MDEINKDLPSDQGDVNKEEGDPSDKLTPDHPRFKDVIAKNHQLEEKNTQLEDTVKGLQAQFDEMSKKIEARQEKTGEDELTPEELASLERIDRALREKKGYVTKEELERQRKIDRDASEFKRLSEKYVGGNGLPKFVLDDVVAHAKMRGFGDNYEAAYKDMHEDALIEHAIKQRGNPPEVPTSERPSGGEREVQTDQISPEDIGKMSDEEYEKQREKLLQAIKPKISS